MTLRAAVRLRRSFLYHFVGSHPGCDLQSQSGPRATTASSTPPPPVAPPARASSCRSHQRNPAHDHLYPSSSEEPNPPVCSTCNVGRNRSKTLPHPEKADAVIPRRRIGHRTYPALDLALRYSV